MIIDIHTHTFPDEVAPRALRTLSEEKSHTRPYSDGTASGLISSMKSAGIDYTFVMPVATSMKQVRSINERAFYTNSAAHLTGLYSFGAMHPAFDRPEEELERLSSEGFKGIKVHPVFQDTDLDDPAYISIFRKCAELRLIVLAHTGYDIGYPRTVDRCSPRMVARVLEQVPGLTLIAAHMGGWKQWEDVPVFLAGSGVYLDTSVSLGPMEPLSDETPNPWYDMMMLTDDDFMRIADAVGTDHLLFGTDSPWSDPAESIRRIRALPLSDNEKEQILGLNARSLLLL